MAAGSMETLETHQCEVPGTFWLLPLGHQIPSDEPTKRLYVHVIPQRVTYQILIDVEVPISGLFDAMLHVTMSNKEILDDKQPEWSLYYKKSIVNTIDATTNNFKSGATFLMRNGESPMPLFHSGNLWPCQSCSASFESIAKLMQHLTIMNHHQMANFGVPTNWGSKKEPTPKKIKDHLPSNARRDKMNEALMQEESTLEKFVPDEEDLEWENLCARRFVVKKSQKWKHGFEDMDPDFIEAIQEGGKVPSDCKRMLTGTWEAYKPYLRKIVTFYQGVKGKLLHYRNFLAFGTSDLVQLCDPEEFVNQYVGASPEMMKKFLAAHSTLIKLVEQDAMSPSRSDDFGKLYDDPKTVAEKGPRDKDLFLSNLERITKSVKNKGLWSEYKARADSKRKHANELDDKLINRTASKSTAKIKEGINKFLGHKYAIQSEKDLLRCGNDKQKLSKKEWVNCTEFAVTRLQIISSGRREATDMTVGEWENRTMDADGSAIINRTFTKLEGTMETFIHLDAVETFLVTAYENAKLIQFPELDKQERRQLQSFFVNSAGTEYIGKKGNPAHFSHWNAITGIRLETKDFRRTMASWSLSTDQVTRANTAFVCAHSLETMTKVYANQKMKKQKAIEVLLKYRDEALGMGTAIGTSRGRSEFLSCPLTQLPEEVAERQKKLRLASYDNALSKALRNEREYHAGRHANTPDKPACDDSRASLLELIVEELESGVPATEKVGFMADVLLKREKDEKKKKYAKSISRKEAIISLIDSPRFEKCPAAISLTNILILAASAKVGKDVDSIEEEAVKSWVKQLENMNRGGRVLHGYRTRSALVRLANISGTVETYSFGNEVIEGQVRAMQNSRKLLEQDDQTSPEVEQKVLQPKTVRRSPRTVEKGITDTEEDLTPIKTESPHIPTRTSPSFVQSVSKKLNFTPTKPDEDNKTRKRKINLESPATPSPIKVQRKLGMKRQPNWNYNERIRLLEHILKNMEDPTLGRSVKGTKDLELNVLPKFSPNLVEKPEESRKLDEIAAQFYRYISLLDYISV